MRTIAEWDAFYQKKTGDSPALPPGFARWYVPERGWCQWRIDREGGLLLLWAVAGDGKFWRDMARAYAAAEGLRAIGTICTRPVLAYIRLWGWRIERDEVVGGRHRYYCRTQDGRPVLLTYKHTDADGSDAYWVTEYLTCEKFREIYHTKE